MSLDITGFTQQDVTITVEDHVVFVKGERTNRLGDVFVLDRKFRLDKKTALVEEVTATFDNDGILEITVPKKSLVGPRTIPIVVTTTSRTSDESASEGESRGEKPKGHKCICFHEGGQCRHRNNNTRSGRPSIAGGNQPLQSTKRKSN
jgi:hypothetical protein